MIRTLNFTGRKRIPRDAARITLRREAGGAVAFDAELDFDGFELPSRALVFIEAAFKTTFMRFDWGTVAELVPPASRTLSRLEQPGLAHYRVKVVEPAKGGGLGRLLAVADHIAPEGLRGGEKRRVSLFRVNPLDDLADEVWKLSFDLGGPILELSRQVSYIKDLVRQEAFMALVFPSVVRQIFVRIFDEGIDDPRNDPDSWQARWLKFGERLANAPTPSLSDGQPDETHKEWIDAAVTAWSRRQKLIVNFKKRFAGTEATAP